MVSAAAAIGLAIAPVLTTQVGARLGWRAAFFIAGAPRILLGILIAIFVEEGEAATAERRIHRPKFADLVHMLRYRNLWACAIGAAGFMSWLFLINTFGPLYITRIGHQAATTAGFLMGAAGLGSFFIGWIAPALSDRFGRRRILACSALLSVLLPLALLTKALYGGLWMLAAILFMTQAGQAISAICIVLVPTESVPKNLAATAIGFTTMFGEVIGGFVAPLAAGAAAEHHGLTIPLWMAAIGALVVFLSALAMRGSTRAVGDMEGLRMPERVAFRSCDHRPAS